jgi:hypothetical protein
MQIHSRAKLGPAGRLALCQAIEGGLPERLACDCTSVAASICPGLVGRAPLICIGGRSLQPSSSLAEAPGRRRAGADLSGSPAHRPGASPGCGENWPLPLNGVEGASSPRPLAAPTPSP